MWKWSKNLKMITNDITSRVFQCRNTAKSATCFSILEEWKIYYITAKHFLENPATQWWIEIFYKNQWKKSVLKNVKHSSVSDISIFTIDWEITIFETAVGMNWLVYGQDIYFLWFPYKYLMNIGELNRWFPFPLVKGWIISWMFFDKPWTPLFLDGHNNPWFSGWPIVFKNTETWKIQIGGVVSGNLDEKKPIYTWRSESKDANLHIQENSWIIVGYSISNALDMIKNNP